MSDETDRVAELPKTGVSFASGMSVNTAHADFVRQACGLAPAPTIVTFNPAYEKWVERAGLHLCDEAGELGEIPTPCSPHLAEARRIAYHLSITVMNGAVGQ